MAESDHAGAFDGDFAVVETTDPHLSNGKAWRSESRPSSIRRPINFEIPPEKRPETAAELSRLRTEQAAQILFARGLYDVARDSISEISEALARCVGEPDLEGSPISHGMWTAVLNGYISLSEELVQYFLSRLDYPRWADDILWGLFCVSIRRQEPAPAAKDGEPLVPVMIFVDPLSNTLQIQVPDGYILENQGEARVDDGRLYVEVRLKRER